MKRVSVAVGRKTYRCELAETPEERRVGLSGRKHLPADEGMVFDFSDSPDDTPEMWMKDTTIPLDMIGIDDEGVVIQKSTPKPESEELIPFPNCKYILEVNAKSGIREGNDFDIDDNGELDRYTMKILAPDGTTQGLLQGGERIFSMVSTRKMIRLAKKAFADRRKPEIYRKDCKALGLCAIRELRAQEEREPQYVDLPDNGGQ